MKEIGIDIGTTSISGVVIDADSRDVVCSKTIPNDSTVHTENIWEKIQEPQKITAIARALLDELINAFPDVSSIGLTGQMHGILYADEKGNAVSPLYTWQDGRGNLLQESGYSLVEEINNKTGDTVASGYGLVTHIYNSRNGIVPDDACKIMTIPDYFGCVLTSRTNPVMHTSMAASIGFFDVEKGEFNVSSELLPEVSKDMEVLGEYRDIPVTVAIGDNQASYLGTVEEEENVLLFNMGTGGQISLKTTQYAKIPGIDTRPYLGESFLFVGSSLCGGRAYAVLEQFFKTYVKEATGCEDEQYGTMAAFAEQGRKQRELLCADTRFSGTRSDAKIRGSITGISESNFTPSALIYGVIEGMVRELFDYYKEIQSALGISVDRIMASGNGIRKNKVMQEIVKEMFGVKFTLSTGQEEAARGAAISSIAKGGTYLKYNKCRFRNIS